MNTFKKHHLLAALVACLPMTAMAQQVGSGAVSLTGPGAGASQDFNTLGSVHGATSDVLPAGWYFLEVGNSNANGTYLVDDGSSPSGNTFSYGANGSSERALGVLASNSVQATIGAQLKNDSGSPLSDLQVSFHVEQWRLGTLNGADKLTFSYSTDATSLSTGTWTAYPALDAIAPVTAGTAGTKLDGNAVANRAEVSALLSGLSLPPSGTLWIRWADANDADVDDALAIDDIVFGTPVDVAPTLLASIPVNGATDFPADASLMLTFSEAVNVSGNWFTFVCGTSGTHTPANTDVSGGPITFFLTPPTPLAVGETCVLSFDTAQITDQGPSEFPLENPGTISFVVAEPPPNLPPSVSSTVPSQGASNFPSAGDLKVTFNEPVVLGSGAFTLTCAQSSGIALTPSTTDGGVNFTIDTGTALIAGDSCQFGIHANAIVDLLGAPLDQNYTISFTVLDGANTGTYYQNVNLANPGTLRCSIYDTIKGHTKYPYSGSGTNTWAILNLADEDPVDTSKILDHFRNESFTKITGGEGAYNREHTWPRSYGLGSTSTPGPATDTHMLHLTHAGYNSSRGNKPFANCDSGCTRLGTVFNHGIGGDSNADSNWYAIPDGNDGSFEVWDHIKGNMARAVMYMAMRYQGEGGEPHLELTDSRSLITGNGSGGKHYMGLLTDLLAWNTFDAPNDRELNRNEIVFSFQNNRNPFINHPEWARRELFETPRPASCALNLNAPVANADSYAVAQDGSLVVPAATGVLLNDSDVEFAAAGSVPADWFKLTAEQLSIPLSGSVSLSANGSFTYTAAAGFCGTDSFTYRTSDGTRWSTPTTVTIAVGTDCEAGSPAIFADGFEQD